MDEVFVTDIKSSGLKIFTYSLIKNTARANGSSQNSNRGKGSGSHGGRGGKGSGKGNGGGGSKADSDSSMKQYFIEMLESKLKSSGYCREGYIELNSYFGRGELKMRGECEEGATEEDRKLFINTKGDDR